MATFRDQDFDYLADYSAGTSLIDNISLNEKYYQSVKLWPYEYAILLNSDAAAKRNRRTQKFLGPAAALSS
jgi:hypothetical protein